MGTVILNVLKTMLSKVVAAKFLEWAIKYAVNSVLEVAVAKYEDRAAKTPEKGDDKVAAALREGAEKLKEAWK